MAAHRYALPTLFVACAHGQAADGPMRPFERTSPVLSWEHASAGTHEYAFEAQLLDGVLGWRSASATPEALGRLLMECPPPHEGRLLGDGLAPAGLPPEFAAWVAISEWQDGASGVRSRSESRSELSGDEDSQQMRTHERSRFRLGGVQCVTSTRTSDVVEDQGASPVDLAIRDFGSQRQQDLEAAGLVHERGLVRGRLARVDDGYELSLQVAGRTNALSVSALEATWSLLCRSNRPIYVRELPVALSGTPFGAACRVGAGPVPRAGDR